VAKKQIIYERNVIMTYIELEPELDACVETQARRQYSELARHLLEQGEDEELVQRLEILWRFLSTADFPQLRRESEKHLAEGKKVRFVLELENGQLKQEMEVC